LSYKSGLLSQNAFIKTLKSQLGTGYYFFGDLNDALELVGVKKSATSKIKELENTKVYKADFSKYKLLKPGNASEFYDKEKSCLIHSVKPSPCSLWPFYPANLKDAYNWEMAKDACPGINPDCSFEDFVKESKG